MFCVVIYTVAEIAKRRLQGGYINIHVTMATRLSTASLAADLSCLFPLHHIGQVHDSDLTNCGPLPSRGSINKIERLRNLFDSIIKLVERGVKLQLFIRYNPRHWDR